MTKEEFKKGIGELWLNLELSDEELERFCEATDKIFEMNQSKENTTVKQQ